LNKRRISGLITATVGGLMLFAFFTAPDAISDTIPDKVWFCYILVSVWFVIFGFAIFFFAPSGELNEELNEKKELERYYGKKAYITYTLIAGNIILFILSNSVCAGLADTWSLSKDVMKAGRWYTLFTYMFVHANALHLLFNMFVLGVCGYKFENIAGRAKLIILYLASGLIGGIIGVLFTDDGLIGSSGAVYGIIGAMLVISVMNRDKMKYYLNELIVIIAAGIIESLIFMPMSAAVHLFGFLTGVSIIAVSRKDEYKL